MNRRRSEEGFTLVELLVAITILGIIMGTIGAMIVTAFRTTATVSDELNGSRGPKLVSRYWVPDVENAVDISDGGGCGGGSALVTFHSVSVPDTTGAPDAAQPSDAPDITITWSVQTTGARTQLVRTVCGGANNADRTPVVPDLDPSASPEVSQSAANPDRWTLTATVPAPERKTFTFDISATREIPSVPTT